MIYVTIALLIEPDVVESDYLPELDKLLPVI